MADEEKSVTDRAGWGSPGNSRKFHYFDADERTSLCGRWGFYFGPRDAPDARGGPEDCQACNLKLVKRDCAEKNNA